MMNKMIDLTKFYITANDVKLLKKVLTAITPNLNIDNYSKQSLFKLIFDMNNATKEKDAK